MFTGYGRLLKHRADDGDVYEIVISTGAVSAGAA
jgi:hypothetical protein